jgi:hypothetical protein
MNDWEELFFGREAELKTLEAIWQLASTGKPQIGVLIGETGLGKTRIIQEFYRRLAVKQQKETQPYWSTTLSNGKNLSLQPVIQNESAQIPWLWWSMRWQPEDGRNMILRQSPFEEGDSHLLANVLPIIRKRKRNSLRNSAALTLSTILADVASVGLYGSALALFDLIKARNEFNKTVDKDIASLLTERTRELVENTLNYLRLFLDKTQGTGPTVPVILVLDDAQWMDQVSVDALAIIFEQARHENWPLMVLASHWAKEWNESESKLLSLDLYNNDENHRKHNFTCLYDIYHYFSYQDSNSCNVSHLATMQRKELESIVIKALPGLTSEQTDKIVTEADGNPRAMEEMIRLLLTHDRNFTDGNPINPLSKIGLSQLAKIEKTDLYRKVMERFDNLDESLQYSLTAGAFLGTNFLHPLVFELLNKSELLELELTNISQRDFHDAETIHVLIQSVTEASHEFQQKIYHQVASDYLKDELSVFYDEYVFSVESVIDHWLDRERFGFLSTPDQVKLSELAFSRFLTNSVASDMNITRRAFAFEQLSILRAGKNSQTYICNLWAKIILLEQQLDVEFFLNIDQAKNYILKTVKFDVNLIEPARALVYSIIEALRSSDITCSQTALSLSKWLSVCCRLEAEYLSVSFAKELIMESINILEEQKYTSQGLNNHKDVLIELSQNYLILAELSMTKFDELEELTKNVGHAKRIAEILFHDVERTYQSYKQIVEAQKKEANILSVAGYPGFAKERIENALEKLLILFEGTDSECLIDKALLLSDLAKYEIQLSSDYEMAVKSINQALVILTGTSIPHVGGLEFFQIVADLKAQYIQSLIDSGESPNITLQLIEEVTQYTTEFAKDYGVHPVIKHVEIKCLIQMSEVLSQASGTMEQSYCTLKQALFSVNKTLSVFGESPSRVRLKIDVLYRIAMVKLERFAMPTSANKLLKTALDLNVHLLANDLAIPLLDEVTNIKLRLSFYLTMPKRIKNYDYDDNYNYDDKGDALSYLKDIVCKRALERYGDCEKIHSIRADIQYHICEYHLQKYDYQFQMCIDEFEELEEIIEVDIINSFGETNERIVRLENAQRFQEMYNL